MAKEVSQISNHFNHNCVCCGMRFTDYEIFREGSDIFQKDKVFIRKSCLYKMLQDLKINTEPVSIDHAIMLLLRRAKELIEYGFNKKNQNRLRKIFSIFKLIIQEQFQTLGQFFERMLIKTRVATEEAKDLLMDIYMELACSKKIRADELFAQPI